jgi:hypothetical protein
VANVRADWHFDALEQALADADSDPASEIAQLKSEGTVIDLTPTRTLAEVQGDLNALLKSEGRYAEYAHLECPLKWDKGHKLMGGQSNSCYRCPEYTENREHARSLLCSLGRQQEDLCEEMTQVLVPRKLDLELVAAHCRRIDAGQELADALLTAA